MLERRCAYHKPSWQRRPQKWLAWMRWKRPHKSRPVSKAIVLAANDWNCTENSFLIHALCANSMWSAKLTGVVYSRPMLKPMVETGIMVCQGFNAGNASLIAVTMHEHMAILLPMPSTNNMKKNRMENNCNMKFKCLHHVCCVKRRERRHEPAARRWISK